MHWSTLGQSCTPDVSLCSHPKGSCALQKSCCFFMCANDPYPSHRCPIPRQGGKRTPALIIHTPATACARLASSSSADEISPSDSVANMLLSSWTDTPATAGACQLSSRSADVRGGTPLDWLRVGYNAPPHLECALEDLLLR